MLKRVVLLIGFLSTFTTSFAQHETAAATAPAHGTEAAAPVSEDEKIKTENKNFIDHHLLDGHSFDIMVAKNADGTENHIGFPLPVIFYDNASLKLDGYNSKIHLIDSNFSWWSYIIFPLIWKMTSP